MKLAAFLCLALAGCCSPCRQTARSAAAMARHCIEVGDPKLAAACESAYGQVRDELTAGVCAVEVAK